MKCEPVLSPALDSTKKDFSGACHCGAVRFRAVLSAGLSSARRCNCSLCRMRGAVTVSARLADFEILEGAEYLSLYEFNTRTAKHYFCSRCGIYTHHKRRSDPTEYGLNSACLEGVSPFDFEEVPVSQGVFHPSDPESAGRPGIVGILSFKPISD
ncbi:GFA family protein [Roseibium sp. CAU 1637]|uniref:GFA family protein n=1 Tax=Roseibium limicola TaxID=2816037 RepID=A0A939ESP0_9HYPH|nr:GFA family protein [Roseibium limicola]MBO0346893.1 GFA family protein [Roseibium limicola]